MYDPNPKYFYFIRPVIMSILYISVYIQTHKTQHVNVIQIPTNTNEIKLPFAGKEVHLIQQQETNSSDISCKIHVEIV